MVLTNFTRSGFMASSDHFTALIDERNKQEGKWWRNEAGQPENACRGVIETLPVGVIPYREAYLPNAGTVAIFDVWSLSVRM